MLLVIVVLQTVRHEFTVQSQCVPHWPAAKVCSPTQLTLLVLVALPVLHNSAGTNSRLHAHSEVEVHDHSGAVREELPAHSVGRIPEGVGYLHAHSQQAVSHTCPVG